MKIIKFISITGFILFLSISIFVGGILAGAYLERTKPSGSIPVQQTEISKEKLWDLIQEWRADNGYAQYVEYAPLCAAAEARIPQVKENWSHDGYIETSSQYLSFSQLGENIARYHLVENDILAAWLNSASHEANLRDDYTYSCIATDGNYVVHLFYTP